MDSITVRLRFLSYPQLAGIVLPLSLCQKLQLRHRQKIVLSHGKRETVATLYQDKRNPDSNVIKLTSSLKTELGVPHGGLIHLKREGETIRIGPAIGILTTGVQNNSTKPIGPRSSFFHKLLLAQKGKGVYYFIFSPNDVDWEHNTVHAWFLRPKKQGGYEWKKLLTALPDVVYDRIPSRGAERLPHVQQFKVRLANQRNMPMFNQGFFNKWGVHQLLYPNPDVNQHIPETYTPPTLALMRSMLKKHPIVYLKPKNGSLGYGIIKVTRAAGGYDVSYHNGSGNVKRRFQSVSSLYQHIFRNRRLSNYLIQQGIALCTYQNRPFDFRVHLHKNQQNEWVVSCMAAKVAGAGSVTTHVRTGGMVIPGEEMLAHLFRRQKSLIEERIRDASIRLASAIEEAKGVYLGELGLDMG
ncbi:MAG: YheC/YheD family protein, partial [Clostridia bacterium]